MTEKKRLLVVGRLYLKNKEYKLAESSFNEYLSTNPEDVEALKQLAQVYESLKKFDKAFETYERCYLTEPDRTGVLLDICRILLMNDVHLDHVDYRKWLNLAIKAYPSNPIVVNYKAALRTLPPDEKQESPQLETAPKINSKTCSQDSLLKILEKLSSMEKKIENIEAKLENLTINEPTSALPGNLTINKPTLASPGNLTINKPTSASPENLTINKPTLAFPGNLTFNKPTSALPENLTINKPTSAFPGNLTFNKPTSALPENLTINGPTSTLPNPVSWGQPVTFNFPSSSDLFKSSLMKFNMPTEGAWTTKQNEDSGDAGQGGEGDGLVPNEELAIEHTCDLTPIEMKTGEEDEDLLFENRCKLFRFRDKEYKERGLGSIKVLKHKTTGKGRLIMRREAINLVCLNCWDCSKIERVRDTQIRWIGMDASDSETCEATVFLVKFKTPELTDEFMSHLTALFPNESSLNNSSIQKSPQPNKANSAANEKSDVELVDPKLDQSLVDKARQFQLPDLFYHKLKNQEPCSGCKGCKDDKDD